jgi:hypothetical protein
VRWSTIRQAESIGQSAGRSTDSTSSGCSFPGPSTVPYLDCLLSQGALEPVTHNYKRHGQPTIYAVLELKSGLIIGDCQRHRFLKLIDRSSISISISTSGRE